MLSIKKWSLQIVECPIVEMQFYFSGGAIEADNKGVARTKALNIIPSTGQPGFLYLSFLPMASTASHLPSLAAGRPHLSSSGWLFVAGTSAKSRNYYRECGLGLRLAQFGSVPLKADEAVLSGIT
jgi:hypothetical protein